MALNAVGALDRLHTDFYTPDWVSAVLRHLPVPRSLAVYLEKLTGRSHPDLPAHLVVCPIRQKAIAVAWRNLTSSDPLPSRVRLSWELGRAAGAALRGRRAAAIVYSYYWLGFLDGLGNDGMHGPRVLFQVHPLPSQVREILASDREQPTAVPAPLREEELLSEEAVLEYERAATTADFVITASRFVASGFERLGYPSDRVHVVPYGGDFTPRLIGNGTVAARRTRGTRLRLLFVGQLLYRKGLHHLLAALEHIDPDLVELTMVCRDVFDLEGLLPLPSNVRLRRAVSDAELLELFRDHDVFVMPSLLEGFGLVYLEALSCGLPIICTENTGGPEILANGGGGVVVPAGDPSALAREIMRLAESEQWLQQLRVEANAVAPKFTWGNYRSRLIESLAQFERVAAGNSRGQSSTTV